MDEDRTNQPITEAGVHTNKALAEAEVVGIFLYGDKGYTKRVQEWKKFQKEEADRRRERIHKIQQEQKSKN